MSTTAKTTHSDGTVEIVHINDIRKRKLDGTETFACNGHCRGLICGVPMTPVIREVGSHFRAISPHMKGCPNDESSRAKEIAHLDWTGKNSSIEELWDSFSGKSETDPKKKSKGTGPTKGESGPVSTEESDDTRPRRHTSRAPSKLLELILLLITLGKEAFYANRQVDDILIDRENISRYRAQGIPTERGIITLCKRVNPQRIEHRIPDYQRYQSEKYIIMEDAYAYSDRAGASSLLFLFPATNAARDKIFNASKDEIFALFARWKQHLEVSKVYICEAPLSSHCILVETEDFFSDN